MIKKLCIILFLLPNIKLFAQTVKTDVLVIGGTPSGVAAAIQCARSKVKTVLVPKRVKLENSVDATRMLTINADGNIPSGIWGEFQEHINDLYKNRGGRDTTIGVLLKFEKVTAETVLKKMTDTVKNLTVYLNSTFTSIKKDGDRWEVKVLLDGKKTIVKASVIIDATETGEVAEKAGAKFREKFIPYEETLESKLYRTAIATKAGGPGLAKNIHQAYWFVPVEAVLAGGVDNLLVTDKILPVNASNDDLQMQLELGQGAGTVAAYCAFFKTTTKHLNIRAIQGELLDFKGYLLPFVDVGNSDRNWRAIQQVCATGLLGGILHINIIDKTESGFIFMPDAPVTTAEIKPVLTEIYTRAFLWFNKEKPGEKFTIENTLSLISDYTLTEPLVLKSSVQKSWKTQYKFKADFDLKRPITRREFAVLANKYLNPFGRTVDLNGRLVN